MAETSAMKRKRSRLYRCTFLSPVISATESMPDRSLPIHTSQPDAPRKRAASHPSKIIFDRFACPRVYNPERCGFHRGNNIFYPVGFDIFSGFGMPYGIRIRRQQCRGVLKSLTASAEGLLLPLCKRRSYGGGANNRKKTV